MPLLRRPTCAHARCLSGALPGWSTSKFLAGPIPDDGAAVSYLHAETNAAVSGATIKVIDNGVTLQECARGH